MKLPLEFTTTPRFKLTVGVLAITFILTGIGAAVIQDPKTFTTGVVLILSDALIFLGMIVHAVRNKIHIRIDESGIQQTGGSQDFLISWREPHSVYYKITELHAGGFPIGFDLETKVTTEDLRTIFIGPLAIEAHTAVRNLSTNALLPSYTERYNNGDTIEFGPVSISRDQISIADKTYSRTDIKSVTIKNGDLRLELHGKWMGKTVPAALIPNFYCLYSLLNPSK